MAAHTVYAPADRPLCEVELDGTWHPGEVRMWTQHDHGWEAQVTYSLGPGDNRIGTFEQTHIRPVTDDPSATDSDTPHEPAQPA